MSADGYRGNLRDRLHERGMFLTTRNNQHLDGQMFMRAAEELDAMSRLLEKLKDELAECRDRLKCDAAENDAEIGALGVKHD